MDSEFSVLSRAEREWGMDVYTSSCCSLMHSRLGAHCRRPKRIPAKPGTHDTEIRDASGSSRRGITSTRRSPPDGAVRHPVPYSAPLGALLPPAPAEQGAMMADLRYSDGPGGATPAIEGAHAGTAPAPGHRPSSAYAPSIHTVR